MRSRKKSKNKNLRKLEKIKEMELHSKDKEYILNLVQEDIDLLELVNTELLIDKSFMISVIKLNGLAFKYASDELKDDEDFVKVALQNSAGFALKYASKRLREDRNIVYEAINKYKAPLKYTSEEIRRELTEHINEFNRKHRK